MLSSAHASSPSTLHTVSSVRARNRWQSSARAQQSCLGKTAHPPTVLRTKRTHWQNTDQSEAKSRHMEPSAWATPLRQYMAFLVRSARVAVDVGGRSFCCFVGSKTQSLTKWLACYQLVDAPPFRASKGRAARRIPSGLCTNAPPSVREGGSGQRTATCPQRKVVRPGGAREGSPRRLPLPTDRFNLAILS